MKVLLACEKSGIVRDEFIKLGHEAISCDILPSDRPGPHYQGYLEDFIGSGKEWDMIIAFPPCTYLCSSGLHWNKRRPDRAEQTEYALMFVAMILNAIRKCGKGSLENPIGCISTRIAWIEDENQYIVLNEPNPKHAIKPSQIVQPHQFGDDASKATCLFTYGLPNLKPTKHISPRIVNGKERWANQTDSGQNRLGPSDTRAMERSQTYLGIAKAMAEQWG